MEIEKHIQNLKDYIRIDKDNINYDDSDFAQFCKSHCEDIQAVLDELNNRIPKFLYDELNEDFESYKSGKDINYLDNNHHKKLVEKSLGQIIKEPEECWFDSVEVKIIRNNTLYRIVDIKKDFVTLKELSDKYPEECFTVIAESPLSGAIYRYNNNGKHEWQLIGTMYGYA